MTNDKEQLEIIGDYWTQRSEGFSEQMLQNMEADEKGLYVRTIREFSDARKMKILDIGTGPGLFPIILGKDGHDVTAIDCRPLSGRMKRCAITRPAAA